MLDWYLVYNINMKKLSLQLVAVLFVLVGVSFLTRNESSIGMVFVGIGLVSTFMMSPKNSKKR